MFWPEVVVSDKWGRQPEKNCRGKEVEEVEEDSMSEEGSDGSRKVWLLKFSTMKVGTPKGVKAAADQTDAREAQSGTGDKSVTPRRPIRTVGEAAKRQLK